MILEQDQPWPPTSNIKAPQHFDFMTLHINQQKIKSGRAACFHQNAVQRPDGHVDDFFEHGAGRHPLAIKR